jgi:hypothetical protein
MVRPFFILTLLTLFLSTAIILRQEYVSTIFLQQRNLITAVSSTSSSKNLNVSNSGRTGTTSNNCNVENNSSTSSELLHQPYSTVEEYYQEYFRYLHSSSSKYVPNGHTTIFVPQVNKSTYYYNTIEEMQLRYQRFPSVQDRVKLYMSNWYIPPCEDNIDGHVHYKYSVFSVGHKNDTTTNKSMGFTPTKSTVVLQPISTSTGIDITSNATPITMLSVDTTYTRDPTFFLYDRDVITNECTDNLCYDAHQYFIPYVDQYYTNDESGRNTKSVDKTNDIHYNTVPLLLQHGDANFYRAKVAMSQHQLARANDEHVTNVKQIYVINPNIPIFKKFRRSMTITEIESVTQLPTLQLSETSNQQTECYTNGEPRRSSMITPVYASGSADDSINSNSQSISRQYQMQPIISIVSNFGRHFYPLMAVITADRNWDQKISKAIYRGLCTGRSKSIYNDKKIRNELNVTDYDWCQHVPRCRLVYNYSNSTLVDAKLTSSKNTIDSSSFTIHGVKMVGRSLSMDELLKYKGIMMIEGNDVSSGLKWALFSKSVVFTQKPTYTSWAMEELLVPWKHYIPIANDLLDVEEKVQWMIDHDIEAQEIANNGHLWITDMIFHPEAMHDHEEIVLEIFQRYRAHFMYDELL